MINYANPLENYILKDLFKLKYFDITNDTLNCIQILISLRSYILGGTHSCKMHATSRSRRALS